MHAMHDPRDAATRHCAHLKRSGGVRDRSRANRPGAGRRSHQTNTGHRQDSRGAVSCLRLPAGRVQGLYRNQRPVMSALWQNSDYYGHLI